MKILHYPLIERYYTHTNAMQNRQMSQVERLTSQVYSGSPLTLSPRQEAVMRSHVLHNQAYDFAQKYYLTTSALTMVSYLQPALSTRCVIVRLPDRSVWMETEHDVLAPDRSASGVFFWKLEHPLFVGTWILTIIDGQGQGFMNFAYSETLRRWEFSSLHRCPFQSCTINGPQGEFLDPTPQIVPCRKCSEALEHWQSWFAIALLAVQGAFAQTAENKPIEVTVGSTSTQIGKGEKNTQRNKQHVEHTYRMITFDACFALPRETGRSRTEHDAPGKSWLQEALKVNPASVLYVQRSFLAGTRELDPERHPRWKTKRTVPVRAYEKGVPMLLEKVKWQFTRVVASEY